MLGLSRVRLAVLHRVVPRFLAGVICRTWNKWKWLQNRLIWATTSSQSREWSVLAVNYSCRSGTEYLPMRECFAHPTRQRPKDFPIPWPTPFKQTSSSYGGGFLVCSVSQHTHAQGSSDWLASSPRVLLTLLTSNHGSQGLGLEPNKDLIRTCKDQY